MCAGLISDSGLYGVFALDGAALARDSFEMFAPSAPGVATQWAGGAVVQAVDHGHADTVQCLETEGDILALVGHLDEAEALAKTLGLARSTPLPHLLRAAVEHWGDDTPTHVLGEWSFVWWHHHSRHATLLSALNLRDHIFYAVYDGKLAVAPNVLWFERLGWVDTRIDELGFCGEIGRASVRAALQHRSLIRGARKLLPGTCVEVRAGDVRVGAQAQLPDIAGWSGGFDDAIAETDAVLRALFRQYLAREGDIAITLSGGLDSSLVALYAAQERRVGQRIICLTSVAPPGSGLQDESRLAKSVADHLGLPIDYVFPEESASVYRPAIHHWTAASAPACAPRHYLYDAIVDAAARHGATALIEGSMGEMTLSYPFPLQPPPRTLMSTLRAVRAAVRRRPPEDSWPYCAFHAALAPGLAAQVPDDLKTAWANQSAKYDDIDPAQRWGYLQGVRKLGDMTTQTHVADIRVMMPFRDLRLLRSSARFPASFMQHHGILRAPIRALMRGHLPEHIINQTKGSAFSPDYMLRIRQQADAARARITLFRAANIDQLLDLNWLASALQKAETIDVAQAFKIQATMTTAEFLLWHRNKNL